MAQLVAHLNDIQGVTSSSLVSPTTKEPVTNVTGSLVCRVSVQRTCTAKPCQSSSGFAYGRHEVSPDSEQIEHTVMKSQMRNSVSAEQIQDSLVSPTIEPPTVSGVLCCDTLARTCQSSSRASELSAIYSNKNYQ